MRITFANATRGWGGVKTWTLAAARELARRGHGVRLLVRPGPFAASCQEAGLGVTETSFGFDFHPLRILAFRQRFKAWGTEILICNVGKDLRTAGVAARLLGLPVVQRVGLPRDMRANLKMRLTDGFVRPAMLVPCEETRTGLLAHLPFLAPERVTAILTGKVCKDGLATYPRSPRRLIATSQLKKDKGQAELLRALAACKKQGLGFHLTLCGTGPDEAALKELAHSLGLTERVVFTGFLREREAITRELDGADIFCLPSFSEGLPNALLEGMARGLTPLARNVGGVAEVIPHTLEDCLLAYETDEAGWTAALTRLLTEDDETLLARKEAALGACRMTFSEAGQIDALEDYLRRLVGSSPAAS